MSPRLPSWSLVDIRGLVEAVLDVTTNVLDNAEQSAQNRAWFNRSEANFVPLSPLSFLWRSERAYGGKVAVIDGERSFTYPAFAERVRRLAGLLYDLGVGPGDVVSVLAFNSAALLEAHYAVPLTGGVLNELNTRLDAATIATIVVHSESHVVIVDEELLPLMEAASRKRVGTLRSLLREMVQPGGRPVCSTTKSRSRKRLPGRLRYREDVINGIEHMPEAFLRLWSGKNLGKQLVHVG